MDNTSAVSVNGLIDQVTAGNTTWNLSDSISSTKGTVNLSLLSNGATTAGYNTTGVTTLSIKAIDSNAAASTAGFDVGGMTGLTNVTVANASVVGTTADTLTIGSVPAAASLSINSNGTAQNVTANFASAATSGSADAVNVGVTGRSGTFLVGTGFETMALTGGAAARLAAANSETTASIKTVTVNGVDMRIDAALDTTVTSIDASKATGTINLAATPGSAFSAKGGAGTADILAVSTLTSTHTVTGFETLVATAASTYDLTGADAANLGVGVSAGAVSFTNAAAAQNTIVLGGANQRTTAPSATASLATGGTIGYALKTATGASDTLNITVSNAGTASTGTFTVTGATTATAIENIVINAADFKAVTFTGLTLSTTTTAASSVTVGATASNLTFGTIGLTQGTATLGAANVINFGAVTGTTSATVGTTASLTFTGGTGVDTTTVGVTDNGATATYNMGAGNDVVTVGANAANAATSVTNVNGEAGDDTIFLGGTNVAALTLNINGGDGTDTVRITTGSSFIDKLENVEKLVNLDTGTTTIAASSTAANNSLEITQVAAGVTAFTTTVGQIVSIAGVTAIGTVGATTLTLTGSTGAETLTGSSTVGTTITSGDGADDITLGSGADVIVLGSLSQTGNIIRGFNAGTNSTTTDVLAFDVVGSGETGAFASGTLSTALAKTTTATADPTAQAAGAGVVFAVTADDAAAGAAANSNVLVFSGTFADSATFLAALQTGGTRTVVTGSDGTVTATNFVAIYSTGTDAKVAIITTAANATTTNAATVVEIATLVGITSTANFDSGDFVFV